MNLLFIHGNFPGQFIHLAPLLAQRCGGRTVFLTQSDNPQGIALSGVELMRFATHRDIRPDGHPYLRSSEQAVLRGQAVIKVLEQLRGQGFVPDVVICHGGMGFGLFLKAYLPQAVLVSYMEWFSRSVTSRNLYGAYTLHDQALVECSNLPVLQELVQADQIVCPTHWQRSQFPLEWQPRIELIFDGVDIDYFKPQAWSGEVVLSSGEEGPPVHLYSDQRVLSYATRGMTLRSFPEFMRAAAVAQQQDPQLQVVVAGRDRVCIATRSPSQWWLETAVAGGVAWAT